MIFWISGSKRRYAVIVLVVIILSAAAFIALRSSRVNLGTSVDSKSASKPTDKPHIYPVPPKPSAAAIATIPKCLILYIDWHDTTGGRIKIVRWPDRKPVELKPRIIGKYRLGYYLIESKFSPDGKKILLTANRKLPNGKDVEIKDGKDADVGTDLWILDIERNTLKPLTTDGDGYCQTSWSPDGRYICANSAEGEDLGMPEGVAAPIDNMLQWSHNLYVWDTVTGKRKLLDKYIEDPVWSGDGSHIYYERAFEIDLVRLCRIDKNGGKRKVLPEGEPRLESTSPDGKHALLKGYDRQDRPILIIKTAGVSKTRVIAMVEESGLYAPRQWAPDSRRIMFTNRLPGRRPSVLDIHSGRTTVLADNPYMLGEFLGWSRRGDWVIAEGAQTEDTYLTFIAAVSAQTGEVVTLIPPTRAVGFDWYELD